MTQAQHKFDSVDFDTPVSLVHKAYSEYQEKSKVVFEDVKQIISLFFEKWSFIPSYSWKQFTPGFNDGDPCTFGIHPDGESLKYSWNNKENKFYDDIENKENPWMNTENFPTKEKFMELADDMDKIDNVICQLSDVLEEVFGDSVEVTINRDGTIEIEEYDCGY